MIKIEITTQVSAMYADSIAALATLLEEPESIEYLDFGKIFRFWCEIVQDNLFCLDLSEKKEIETGISNLLKEFEND